MTMQSGISFYMVRTLLATLAVAAWFVFVFISAFYGWWMRPIAAPGDAAGFFQQAVARLTEENADGNSALVLIEEGRIAHEYYSSLTDAIDRDTVFSTASLSKWISAAGVMSLVQEGRLQLDDRVNQHLTRWRLPSGEFDGDAVTVRHLLSHTAGLNDGLGFGDYSEDETLPTLEQSLTSPRASSDREVSLAVSAEPGTAWQYSGGSYLILELLIEEVSGQSFAEYMEAEVFRPLAMDRSGYDYLGGIENNAGSYTRDGGVAPTYKYASNAATAFTTSAADLSRFVLAQIPNSTQSGVLTETTVEKMLEPHGRSFGADIWGLGSMLYAPTPEGSFVFGHDGGNDPAINSIARINPDTGDAIVILQTGHPSLATQIGSQWVLWQTGYPDILDVSAVLSSMILPASGGAGLILLLFIFRAFRSDKTRAALGPPTGND